MTGLGTLVLHFSHYPKPDKKVKKAEQAKKDLDSYLKSRGVPELTKAQKRAVARGDYFR